MGNIFQLFQWLDEAKQGIEHVAAWSGISVGLLLGLAALAYLEPTLRSWCIKIAIGIGIGYCLVIYGHRTGVDDCHAAWDIANKIAAEQAAQRDKNAADVAHRDEWDEIARLTAQTKQDQEMIDALRKSDAACHPITSNQLR